MMVKDALSDAETEGGTGTRALKTLRLLRLAKLLRIARLKKLLEKYEDAFDANQYMGLIVTLFVILFASHMLACGWYIVGTSEQLAEEVRLKTIRNARIKLVGESKSCMVYKLRIGQHFARLGQQP